jgi:hypothetical protein
VFTARINVPEDASMSVDAIIFVAVPETEPTENATSAEVPANAVPSYNAALSTMPPAGILAISLCELVR